MKRKISRREYIIGEFKTHSRISFSCKEVTDWFITREKLTKADSHYLSGSISSILHKLVNDGILVYSKDTTPRGGHLYKWKNPLEWFIYIPEEGDWPITTNNPHIIIDKELARRYYLLRTGRNKLPNGAKIWSRPKQTI